MSELFLTNPQIDPNDFWRNLFWLRGRIDVLETKVRSLEQQLRTVKPSKNVIVLPPLTHDD